MVGIVALILMVFWVKEPRRMTPRGVEKEQPVRIVS